MSLALTEEQGLVRRTARELAEQALGPLAEPMDRQARFAPEARRALDEAGLWGLLAPAEHGGAGLGLLSLALALEEVARRNAAAAVVLLGHNLAARAAPPAWAARLASGEVLGTLGLAEGPLATGLEGPPGALRGAARPFPLAGQAGLALAPLPAGGWAVVPEGHEGSALVPEATLGLRGAGLGQLVLRGARCERLGPRPGLAEARDVGLAAVAAGLGQAAVEEAARFARDRVQFGKPIAAFEGVRARLAEMQAPVDAARALAWQAAALADRGEPAARAAGQAKLLATEAAARGTRLGVKLHGGSGFLKDFAAERLHRDARVLPLLGHDSAAARDAAGRALVA